ncbi:MAG: nuclear transport factor 2 family protein [Syntrophales bacterium]|jgi:ketosteroid isomerase-like protein|nr:nuclear transport factor 2 family protein [Syntrophales bacterium]MDY0045558.1 nuclear transport factor 2 family protein [Syntrophales bacterium]
MRTRKEIEEKLEKWNLAWDAHDLDGVMELFHPDTIFENWTGGQARGKENLRSQWEPWFENHGGFRFRGEDLFIDEDNQKVLYQWALEWPSQEKGYEGHPEIRRGVDIMHFKDGKIFRKLTYIKTAVEIDGCRLRLTAPGK